MGRKQSPRSREWRQGAFKQALIHALCYALLSGSWIVISDYFIPHFYADSPQIRTMQTYKGLSFVAFTSILLFAILSQHYRRFGITESMLKQTVQTYRNLVETSSDLIWSIDAEGRITFINQASEQVYGRKPEEMIGRLYTDFVPANQAELHTQSWEMAINSDDRIQYFENWVLHKDGHPVLLSANAILLRDQQGQIIGSMGTSRDITAQKTSEKELRFQSNLLSAVQQAVIATDLDGNIIYWNDFAEQLYGWKQTEAIGQPIVTITVPKISQSQAEEIMTEMAEKGVWSGEFVVTRKDGSVFPALITNSTFYDEVGNPAGYIGLSIDMSEQKELENELQAAKNNLEAMFYASPAAIVVIDEETNVKQWNPAAERTFGWEASEVLDKPLPLVPEDMWDEFYHYLTTLNTTGGQEDQHVVRRHKDGKLLDLSMSTARFKAADGDIRYMAVYIDISNRLKMVRELNRTKTLLDRTFASLTDAVLVIDASKRSVVMCNTAIEQILGYKPEEVLGKNTEFLHVSPEAYNRFGEISSVVLEEEGTFTTEYRMKHKDGHIIETTHTVALLASRKGLEDGAVSIIRDITEQKQAIRQLQESEAKYRQLFDNAPIMIWQQDFSAMKQYLDALSNSVTDNLRHYLLSNPEVIEQCVVLAKANDVNQAGLNLFGAQSKQDLFDNIDVILKVSDADARSKQLESLLAIAANQPLFRGEFFNQTLRGDNIIILLCWVVLPGYEKTYEKVLVTGVDITQRKQMESDLRDVLNRQRELTVRTNTLRNIAESLVQSTQILTSLKAGVEEFNSILDFDTLSIYSIEQNKLIPLVHHDNNDVAGSVEEVVYTDIASLHSALSDGQTLHLSDVRENTTLRSAMKIADDTQEWIAISLISRGITMGLLCTSKHTSDFSESQLELLETFSYQITSALDSAQVFMDLQSSYQKLKLAQEKTVQATRLSVIGEIAAGVAHQINNPLMTVIADSHLMLKNIEPTSPMRESAEAINRAAHKAGNIVQRLLNFARTTPTDMAEININESIQQTINLVKSQIEPRYAQLTLNFAEGNPMVLGSEEHLQDVWMNLLLNARDAVQDVESGRIQVATVFSDEDDIIEIIVSDNGVGIPTATLENVFDPFFTTKERGTGLGLSICADIVRQHHGTIEVDSTPNHSSRFIVQLPALKQF